MPPQLDGPQHDQGRDQLLLLPTLCQHGGLLRWLSTNEVFSFPFPRAISASTTTCRYQATFCPARFPPYLSSSRRPMQSTRPHISSRRHSRGHTTKASFNFYFWRRKRSTGEAGASSGREDQCPALSMEMEVEAYNVSRDSEERWRCRAGPHSLTAYDVARGRHRMKQICAINKHYAARTLPPIELCDVYAQHKKPKLSLTRKPESIGEAPQG